MAEAPGGKPRWLYIDGHVSRSITEPAKKTYPNTMSHGSGLCLRRDGGLLGKRHGRSAPSLSSAKPSTRDCWQVMERDLISAA